MGRVVPVSPAGGESSTPSTVSSHFADIIDSGKTSMAGKEGDQQQATIAGHQESWMKVDVRVQDNREVLGDGNSPKSEQAVICGEDNGTDGLLLMARSKWNSVAKGPVFISTKGGPPPPISGAFSTPLSDSPLLLHGLVTSTKQGLGGKKVRNGLGGHKLGISGRVDMKCCGKRKPNRVGCDGKIASKKARREVRWSDSDGVLLGVNGNLVDVAVVEVTSEKGGEWKNHHGEYWYEGRRAKVFAFSRDSNYDQLLNKVYNVTGIDRDYYRVSMTTLPQTFRPSMPIEIVDDEDVALLLRRENVDPLVCISVEETGHESPEMKLKPPQSSHNLHVNTMHELQRSDVRNMAAHLDDIGEGLTPVANIDTSPHSHLNFRDTTGNQHIPEHDETEPLFNYNREAAPNRYDE
ncbi:hypothetical protein LWI29_013658 [Acer saccharum]|uniref:Uncharacterized protein n=1 Tax=Acer saccharum TaxID=4024 RepID=A0AA39RQ30_ACESA|nr:hypothetical protein LWI29_013658 [Acer saccharum]